MASVVEFNLPYSNWSPLPGIALIPGVTHVQECRGIVHEQSKKLYLHVALASLHVAYTSCGLYIC